MMGHRFLTKWDGPVTAVASGRATAEEIGRALPRDRAHRIVVDLDRDASRHILIVLHKMATGVEPHSSREAGTGVLLARVDTAVRAGRLLFLEGWDFGDGRGRSDGAGENAEAEVGTSPEENLVRRVMGTRATIEFEGRRYRFVTADLWSKTSRQTDLRVLAIPEARAVVERMAKRPTHSKDERALWTEVLEHMSEARGDDGLVLLREAPTGGSTPRVADVPVMTPSQMKPQVTDWIEIHVLYEDGTPYDGNCVVELPDGRKTEGAPDADGTIRVDGIDPGSCKLTIPDLDKAAWGPG